MLKRSPYLNPNFLSKIQPFLQKKPKDSQKVIFSISALQISEKDVYFVSIYGIALLSFEAVHVFLQTIFCSKSKKSAKRRAKKDHFWPFPQKSDLSLLKYNYC